MYIAVFLPGCSTTKQITIELQSNPSTGYSWNWSQEGTGSLALVEDTFERSSSPLVGAPGKQVFVFSGDDPGSVTLTFTYARPWETTSLASQDTKVFFYVVDSNGNIAESK